MEKAYKVVARWDDEARVWHSESNVPGLVIETASLAQFEQLMDELVPELLSANADLHGTEVPIHLVAERQSWLSIV